MAPKTRGSLSEREAYWDETEVWPPERIQRYQLRRLRRVVRHAFLHLPFYRRRFEEAGFHPDQLNRLEDMLRIPIFVKGDLRRWLEASGSFPLGMEMMYEDWERGRQAALSMTSGTLGEMFLYTSRSWVRQRGSGQMRVMWWSGWRPGMRVLMTAPGWHSLSFVQSWALTRMGAEVIIPWGTFLPVFAPFYVDALLRHRPEFVYLFLPMLYAMLAESRRRGLAPSQVFESVRSVLVVGEPITPRSRRRLLEELGVEDIFEGAGSPEGLEGMECSHHTGHHVNIHHCYVEVIDPGTGRPVKPGERGHLVLTSLADLSTSLYIRVDLEDIAAFLPIRCPCGRSWPLIEVYGRASDLVEVQGRKILHYDVREALEEVPSLAGVPFALVAGEGASPALRLIMEGPPAPSREWVAGEIVARLGDRFGLPVEVKFSEQLPMRWKGVKVLRETGLWERLP